MNIVVITNLSRPQLFYQTINSLCDNATKPMSHTYTVVLDNYGSALLKGNLPREQVRCDVMINIADPVGASRARNIGAGSIPKYRRQDYVMFCDDDIYAAPGWDTSLERLAAVVPGRIISGYSHPYNVAELRCVSAPVMRTFETPMGTALLHDRSDAVVFGEPLVISSVAMLMPWHIFDTCGPWNEPGGAGASEDYALCMRAKDFGFGFAVTSAQCILHTGLLSSTGQKIVGYDELAKQNEELLDLHKIRGKVIFG